jgi:lipid II:glycine glycyltransferase (peptidoglycan interpeptide bridge formation enzyme)
MPSYAAQPETNLEISLELTLTDENTNSVTASIHSSLLIRCQQEMSAFSGSGKEISLIQLDASKPVLAQLPSGPARKIRKALKNGLELKRGGSALLPDFYSIYRRNIKQLGSFGLPFKFFQQLLNNYNHGLAVVYVVYYNGRAIGASLLLGFMGYAENLWFADDKAYSRLYTTYLLHYGMMQDAQAAGCLTYSFGRSSSGGGVHRYKNQFGAVSVPLYYNSDSEIKPGHLNINLLKGLVRRVPLTIARRFDHRVGGMFY